MVQIEASASSYDERRGPAGHERGAVLSIWQQE
jgi:hypothetical protein